MSTSDQQGNPPLTRKQLREIRLTGATPVITEDEAAAAAVEAPSAPVPRPPQQSKAKSSKDQPSKDQPSKAKSAKAKPAKEEQSSDQPAQPVNDQPAEVAPAPKADVAVRPEEVRLTRRQVREYERIRTASVPVIAPEQSEAATTETEPETASEPEAATEPEEAAAEDVVSGVPVFPTAGSADGPVRFDDVDDDDDDRDDEVVDVEPVSAAIVADSTSEAPPVEEQVTEEDSAGEEELPVAEPVETGENHVVSPTFGNGLLAEEASAEKADVPSFAPSFDDLITADSGGSQNLAPNTLIFTPSSGGGSLSGPVASTGEILITGSYELPRGIGSQGHADGAADGKEADAVLLDGELHPSSSPTPIAASSAISTIKPAGEVIRPPAPEKGNKLMLTLAITAGGLALALAVALIVAFTTNIFS